MKPIQNQNSGSEVAQCEIFQFILKSCEVLKTTNLIDLNEWCTQEELNL